MTKPHLLDRIPAMHSMGTRIRGSAKATSMSSLRASLVTCHGTMHCKFKAVDNTGHYAVFRESAGVGARGAQHWIHIRLKPGDKPPHHNLSELSGLQQFGGTVGTAPATGAIDATVLHLRQGIG